MGAFKLFISHSSRLDEQENSDDPEKNPNLKLLLDVIEGIKQEYGETIEILVDKDAQALPAGCDWEKRLNEWLAECHAAVILFSKRARENSNWVKKEAAILSWRRELDRDFILIPVCIKGETTPDDLEKDLFGTLRIVKSQCVRTADCSAEIVAGIQSALGAKEILASKCKRTPFEKLAGVITELLIKNARPTTLEDACLELPDTDKPHFHPDNKVRYADALTRYLLRNGTNCLMHFKSVINKIHPKVEKEHTEEIFKYLRALWVDTKAAGCIPTAANHRKFLAMNGKLLVNYTCKCYAERAWPMSDLYTLILTTHSDEERLIEEIRDYFQPKTRGVQYTPEQCDAIINKSDEPLVVYSPAENGEGLLDDPRLRSKLRTKYPAIIFLLGTGNALPTLQASDIRLIEPQLDLNLEFESFEAEQNVQRFLGKYHGH